MSTQTPNLWLIKQAGGERPLVRVLNDNMDKIDAAVGAVDAEQDGSLQEQINAINTSLPSLLHVEQLSKTIASGADSVSATAPSVTGYTFLTWIMAVPHDWNGYVFVESPLNIVSNMYVANATSGNRTIYCVALYIRS